MGPTSVAPDELSHFKKIYCIVGYCTSEKKHRCFGYYMSYNVAKNALLQYWKSIEECMYDSFFIEEVPEGLQTLSKIKIFYKIIETEKKIIEVDIPTEITNFVNWSIG
jgi:hypothetical protein